jgi:hypothetical protein
MEIKRLNHIPGSIIFHGKPSSTKEWRPHMFLPMLRTILIKSMSTIMIGKIKM